MAAYNSPAVQPINGGTVHVAYPVGQAVAVGFAVVANQSPWTLTVDQGGLVLGYLPAYTANTYPTAAVGSALGFSAQGSAPAAGDGILVTWTDQQPSGAWPVSLPAQAIAATIAAGGSITALQQAEVALSPPSWQFIVANSQKLFTIPAGAPPFSDLLVGYGSATGGGTLTMSAWGINAGLMYCPPTNMQAGQFLTFPFSSVIDPSGIRLSVTYAGGAAMTGTLYVVGLVYPTTVRPYYGVAGVQGPTQAAAVQQNGAGTAAIVAAGTVNTVVRVWSAWITGQQNIPAAAAVGEAFIQVASTGLEIINTLGSSNAATVGSVDFPGGLPVYSGNMPINLVSNLAFARGGLAYSYDSN